MSLQGFRNARCGNVYVVTMLSRLIAVYFYSYSLVYITEETVANINITLAK